MYYIILFIVGISVGILLAMICFGTKSKLIEALPNTNIGTLFIDDDGVCYRYQKKYLKSS